MTTNAPRNESQLEYHRRRAEELKRVRQPWESEWQGLARYIEPTRLRLNSRDGRPVSRKSIIRATATLALRTLQSGMHSGITSPARPWFRLTTFDPDLKDFDPVRVYLSEVERRMREVFQNSNIYNSFHTGYGDLGLFGQSCSLLVEDENSTIRMIPLVHGRFWIARDGSGRATTLYRCFRWSVERIVGRFGLDRVSQTVRSAYDTGKYDDTYDVWHAVEPRMNRDPSKPGKANMRFLSNYWEDGTTSRPTGLLEESGFEDNPIIAPPWELVAEDNYAVSPGMIALGDVKSLQLEVQRKQEAIDKMVRPPMTGPTSLMNNPASTLPGAITYVDDPNRMGFRAAMEVNLRITEISQDIREVEEIINRCFYADLFLMLSNMEGIQPRNTFEIAERKEEKLLALGPVLENIYGAQLEPSIDRTFQIMARNNLLPPPPEELQNQELKIEYISMLAQAQKAVSTGAIERGIGFAGQIASLKPDVLDVIDADKAVEEYFEALGVPPSITTPDDKVKAAREARAQQMQQAQQAEMAATVAPAAKAGAEAANVMASAVDNPGGGELLRTLGLGAGS